MIIKNMRLSAVVSAHFTNALPMQRLENLRVTHKSQVTHRGLSYGAVLLSSAAVPRETFHCAKRFTLVREEGPTEGLFNKEPDPTPPEIKNSTAPPPASGNPIEAGVFNAPNWEEDISLVRNQGLEVDNDMEPDPNNVTLIYTPAAET